jgi:hypothetical protein
LAWFIVTSMPAPALAGSTKAGTARSAASRNDDFMAVIEALHGGRLVQRNMNEIGEPTVKPVAGPGDIRAHFAAS